MWLLYPPSGRARHKSRFFLCQYLPSRHICSWSQATRSYTYFSGLVESKAKKKRGATLQGQRKCSQTDSLRGYHDLRESALEGGLHVRERLSRVAERVSRVFTPTCNPTARGDVRCLPYRHNPVMHHDKCYQHGPLPRFCDPRLSFHTKSVSCAGSQMVQHQSPS